MTLCLCALVAFYLYWLGVERGYFAPSFQGIPPSAEGAIDLDPESDRRKISALETQDERILRRGRAAIDELARRHVGTPLTGGQRDDLRILQQLLDQRVAAPDETETLQAMGMVLGDVMVAQLGFRWVIVKDKLGRSRALQWKDTDAFVFPVTMISKRVEKDVRFTVEELYAKAEEIAVRSRRSTR
jgi:hypothetical protein